MQHRLGLRSADDVRERKEAEHVLLSSLLVTLGHLKSNQVEMQPLARGVVGIRGGTDGWTFDSGWARQPLGCWSVSRRGQIAPEIEIGQPGDRPKARTLDHLLTGH